MQFLTNVKRYPGIRTSLGWKIPFFIRVDTLSANDSVDLCLKPRISGIHILFHHFVFHLLFYLEIYLIGKLEKHNKSHKYLTTVNGNLINKTEE